MRRLHRSSSTGGRREPGAVPLRPLATATLSRSTGAQRRKPVGVGHLARSARVGGPFQRGGDGAGPASHVGISGCQNTARPLARFGGTRAGARTRCPTPTGVHSSTTCHAGTALWRPCPRPSAERCSGRASRVGPALHTSCAPSDNGCRPAAVSSERSPLRAAPADRRGVRVRWAPRRT